jgi:hypothetical protein
MNWRNYMWWKTDDTIIVLGETGSGRGLFQLNRQASLNGQEWCIKDLGGGNLTALCRRKAMGWTTAVRFPVGAQNFYLLHFVYTQPTQPPSQWVPGQKQPDSKKSRWISWLAEWLSASQEGLCSIDLVALFTPSSMSLPERVTAEGHSSLISFIATLKNFNEFMQHSHPKRRYPITTLHSVITQKTATWIFIAVKMFSQFTMKWEFA